MDSEDSFSDEEAPEEFSVSAVNAQHVSQLKNFHQSLKQNKLEEKEKRRRRDELFKAQKAASRQKKKIQELVKLPQDVLDAVSSKPVFKKAVTIESKHEQISLNDDKHHDYSDDNDQYADSGVDINDFDANADFIPLRGSKNLFLATENEVKKKKLTSAEEVKSFKNSHLYNTSIVPRQTYKQKKAIAAKRKMLKKL